MMTSNLRYCLKAFCLFLLVHQSEGKSKINYSRGNFCMKTINSSDSSTIQPRRLELVGQLCLNLDLPYTKITLPENVPGYDFTSFDEVLTYIELWDKVKLIPKCYPYLRNCMYSVLIPRYEEDHAGKVIRISRPNFEICNDLVNKGNCNYIKRHFGWPEIFNCSNSDLYARNCTNELRGIETRVNQTCHYPLVSSTDTSTWFKDIDGCAMSCRYPLLNVESNFFLSFFVKVLSVVGLSSTFIALTLLEINSSSGNDSSIARVIKRCTWCKFFEYLGWSIQIFFKFGCNQEGAIVHEPVLVASWCRISFCLTYSFSMIFMFWFCHLAKLCHRKLTGIDTPSSGTKSEKTMIIISYCATSVVCISVAFLGQVSGYGPYGICTLDQNSLIAKGIFEFLPSTIGVIYANFFFISTIAKLVPIEKKSSLRRNFRRLIILSVISILDLIIRFGTFFYNQRNQETWIDSIDKYIACNLNLQQVYYTSQNFIPEPKCDNIPEPTSLIYYSEIFFRLTPGIVIASWAWCTPNFKGLRRKLIQVLSYEREEDFTTRKRFIKNNNGVYESIHNLIDITTPRPDLTMENGSRHSSLASTNLTLNMAEIDNDHEIETSESEQPYMMTDKRHHSLGYKRRSRAQRRSSKILNRIRRQQDPFSMTPVDNPGITKMAETLAAQGENLFLAKKNEAREGIRRMLSDNENTLYVFYDGSEFVDES